MSVKGKIIAYTDGSCNPNPGNGGCAFIALCDNFEIIDSFNEKETTNNIMEMKAVINLLKLFNEEEEFEIYSDSKYVINCAQNFWKRKKNLELWKEFDKISTGKKIKFIWIKAHNGNKYNELVDKLANEARLSK